MSSPSSSSLLDLIDTTTIFSLLSTLAILLAAYTASLYFLHPTTTTRQTRFLFIWHAFDALIHFILEGSYLYNCFYSFLDTSTIGSPVSPVSSTSSTGGDKGYVSEFLPKGVYFLGREDRVYGSTFGTNVFAALWREYAKADRRWGGSDLTVISLELLTVFLAGPVAVWVCVCLAGGSDGSDVRDRKEGGGVRGEKGMGKAWFWMVVLATGELYGGESLCFPIFLLLFYPSEYIRIQHLEV